MQRRRVCADDTDLPRHPGVHTPVQFGTGQFRTHGVDDLTSIFFVLEQTWHQEWLPGTDGRRFGFQADICTGKHITVSSPPAATASITTELDQCGLRRQVHAVQIAGVGDVRTAGHGPGVLDTAQLGRGPAKPCGHLLQREARLLAKSPQLTTKAAMPHSRTHRSHAAKSARSRSPYVRQMESRCGCFSEAPPMPMGCALCGHPPYAHGCAGTVPDHDYAQPSGTLISERLETRRRLGSQQLPRFTPPAVVAPGEVIPLVPAQRRPEPPPAALAVPVPPPPPLPLPKRAPHPVRRAAPRPAATTPPRRDDGRRSGPRRTRGAVSHARGTRFAPPRHRSSAPYGAPKPLPSPTEQSRPALATTRRILDQTTEVRPMEHPESAAPPPAIPAGG
ncbi:hypothetical protein SAMN05216275_14421 [Streptosporangium canum]|uniref:Uncharacterized protein n=1 Tax=Streptosporangium canum TaxID=324952 RepID=A0A1I4DYW8_9ACTN|nr:hypothetical protein SAMN05216275_14421 [Streptosporangium canum]